MLFRIFVLFFVFICVAVPVGYAQGHAELVAPKIIVNLPSRTLELFSGDQLIKEYPVAIGLPSTPTPLGNFSIVYKEVNPNWYPPNKKGKMVPSGPANPLGYRWIGIWNNYGIHGTNAPWSIGTVVSNGCIRMYEQDVEELFEKVGYGTPVQITYDRVKIRTNDKDQILLAVYPDFYGYGSVTIQDVRRKLNTYHISALVSDDFLNKVINRPSDSQTVAASWFKIKVNDVLLKERGLIVQDRLYVPILTVADVLKQQVNWDKQAQTIERGGYSVPALNSGNVVLITAENLPSLFGGVQSWVAKENTLFFNKQVVFVNENPVNLEVNKVQGILALPVLELAEALGRKVSWSIETQELLLNDEGSNRKVPVEMIGTVPYIKITAINNYFGAYVYWNEQADTIELTYP